MARCALVGALGLGLLVGRSMGHMNSAVNLARNTRRLDDGSPDSWNSKWQCEASEVGSHKTHTTATHQASQQ